jgi:lipopolysaccharide/colanic/teichoic acid biosynthesis glycosyltransferase
LFFSKVCISSGVAYGDDEDEKNNRVVVLGAIGVVVISLVVIAVALLLLIAVDLPAIFKAVKAPLGETNITVMI